MPHSQRPQRPLALCVTTEDFEAPAKEVLDERSWVYASSSASTGRSFQTNLDDWSRINFRPRVLRSVAELNTTRSIFGNNAQYPFFVAAMGSLGSSNAISEPGLVRANARKGLHTVLSSATTKSLEDIMDAHNDEMRKLGNRSPSKLHFQIYIAVDRTRARDLIHRAKKAGYQSLWVTVDASTLGKRTADRYLQAQEAIEADGKDLVSQPSAENDNAPAFGGRPIPGHLDPGLNWDDLAWIQQEWGGPIVLKGVQTVDDVKLAVKYGVQGVLLSNHGGRQIHTAPSALMTLLEIRNYYPEALEKLEIFVDGGLRDGADVLKALCLGATAVGVGRPYFYSLAAYGEEGVEKCTDSKIHHVCPLQVHGY